MLKDIIEANVIENYVLFLRFEDGLEGEIDISSIVPFEGIFDKLKDQDYFKTVKVDHELGTIVWDNGADLSPDYLYYVIVSQKK